MYVAVMADSTERIGDVQYCRVPRGAEIEQDLAAGSARVIATVAQQSEANAALSEVAGPVRLLRGEKRALDVVRGRVSRDGAEHEGGVVPIW